MGNILALDIGSVRIGVAISDPLGIFAQGVGFLDAKGNWLEDLARLINEHDVSTIVVGLPVRTSGKQDKEANEIVSLVEKLKKIFPDITFILWDERYTTAMAQKFLRESNMSGKKRRSKVDMVAASLLLQSYLDFKNLSDDPRTTKG